MSSFDRSPGSFDASLAQQPVPTAANRPESSPRRNVAVRITPDAVRQVRAGSPWVYDGSIDSVAFDAEPGTVAVLFDRKRAYVGVGLFDPDSPIRVKVLESARRVPIDDDFFAGRVVAAIERRRPLTESLDTDAYRLINGENDALPGIVVDRYGATIVAKIYTAAWLPHLDRVTNPIRTHFDTERVVLRLSRAVQAALALRPPERWREQNQGREFSDGMVLHGVPIDGPVRFTERGLHFEADVARGQKTGHFLDQRENRAQVRELSMNADLLDVFASTGGFSVSAAAGGAASVTLIDQSAPALETAQRNLDHNVAVTGATSATMLVGDAFERLARLHKARRTYDIVVVDPPSFAQNQASVANAVAAYTRLTNLALGVLSPGGLLVQCSCSSRVDADDFFGLVHREAFRIGRPLQELRRTFHALDHPIGFEYGAYLKALFAYAP